jgi:predicted DNA-binding transcriptional regulator YafY
MQNCTYVVQSICIPKMPKTKAYSDRRRILNELFRTKPYSLVNLINRVSERLGTSISKKTIQDMIRYMREEGAPIKSIPGVGYIYDPKNYNIENVGIESATVEKIKLAASILEQIPGLDIHDELKDVFEKLEMRTSESYDNTGLSIQFDSRPQYQGAKYLAEILDAISGKTVISFEYQPFGHSTPKRIVVHPYLLKEYNNRWFLIGLTELSRVEHRKEVSQFGLERIKTKIKPEASIDYFIDPITDIQSVYKNIIGVSIGKERKVEKIILKFKAERAQYVTTNPLHASQKLIKQTKQFNTFTFDLMLNKELESLILSFGADVEVLKPKELKESIKINLSAASKNYR